MLARLDFRCGISRFLETIHDADYNVDLMKSVALPIHARY